ncbi:MAG: TIGR03862 family flavoprotein [Actinomycetota bacterium]|nr:TIGR03862 family flavoprotein [Actinomycetota bacterium]
MAAEVLATAGAAVAVHDRMPSVGRKLQLAGRGGLNLTSADALDVLLDRYGPARPRLVPAIRAFGPDDLRDWCAGLGQETFVGTSGRVFPTALRATGLLRAWLERLERLGVVIEVRSTWTGWDGAGDLRFRAGDGEERSERADVAVLALGGASWPRTGSDGVWAPVLRAAGVDVTPLRPANCGFEVAWTPVFRTRFSGAPLKNVSLTHDGLTARGEAMVTATGIEGGAVYALAAPLRDAVERVGAATVEVDLQPDLDAAQLSARLARARPSDSLATVLRRAGLAPVAGGLLREVTGNRPPKDPARLASLAKALPVRLRGVQPLARAISTAGGVALAEVDDDLMLRSRPGTFVAGEMLDWEAPTGGYLLQGAFSTGVAAARGALRWLATSRAGP